MILFLYDPAGFLQDPAGFSQLFNMNKYQNEMVTNTAVGLGITAWNCGLKKVNRQNKHKTTKETTILFELLWVNNSKQHGITNIRERINCN